MRRIKVLIAKPGLDGHDRGAKVIARLLRDSGMEVIYSGLHQTTDQIVNIALQEDVDVIGLSILSGAHQTIIDKLIKKLIKKELYDDILLLVGGNIFRKYIDVLKEMGVAEVFPTGSDFVDIVNFINTNFRKEIQS